MSRFLTLFHTSHVRCAARVSRVRGRTAAVIIVLALCAGMSLPALSAPLPGTPLDGVAWVVAFPWVLASLPVLFLLVQLVAPLWRRSALCRRVARLRFRLAIDRGAFTPGYQPVVCARSGVACGAEVVAYREPDAGRIGTPPPRARLPDPDSVLTPMAQAAAHGLTTPLLLRVLRQAAYDMDITPLPRGFRLSVTLTPGHLDNANVARACYRLQRVLSARLASLTLVLSDTVATDTDPRPPGEPGSPALSRAVRRRLGALRAGGVRLGWAVSRAWPETAAVHWLVDEYRLAAPEADSLFDGTDTAGGSLPDRMVSRVQVLAGLAGAAVVATGVDSACQRTWLLQRDVSRQQGNALAPVMALWVFAQWLDSRACDGAPAGCPNARRYTAAR
ncbi:EAL domain-containing protein [Serratia marcescens]|uniref:EAL domain-containing protein n=1 Tax=Serratia marcescens TaxID=615 RepID=UPI000B17B381|nr:EAL domain-containing protein [Serratia marcescens]